MNIGLDFDGVFTDVAKLKVAGIKELYNIAVPERHVHKYTLINKNLLTGEQYRELNKFIYTSDFGKKLIPVEGIKEYIDRLINHGHNLKIVTSRGGDALEIAKEWLKEMDLPLEIIGVGPGKSKAPIVEENKFDVFVDDDLYKLEPLCGIVPHRFLFSWGYNRHIDESSFVKRVSSWKALYSEIVSLNHVCMDCVSAKTRTF